MKFLSITLAASFASSAFGFAGDNPPCEICGCSFCAEGEFPVLNPAGVIEITEEFLSEFGEEAIPGQGNQTVGDVIGDIGLSEIPCSLLELAASGGAFPPEVCGDTLRLNSFLRDTCGCPALPPAPTPEVVAPPTDAPVPAPTEAPVPAPTEAPVPAPTDPPVPAPTEAPVPAPTDPPMPAPTDPPMPAPTDPPMTAPTEPPMPAPTDPPMPVPTDPPVPVVVITEPPMPAPTDSPVPAPVAPPTGGLEMPTMERCARRRRRRRRQRRD